MSFRRLPQGRRVAVLSASGGAGIHMADEAEKANVEMPVTSLELREKLGTLIPWFGSTVNPVDLTGSVLNDHSMIEGVIKILFESDEFDAVVFAAPAKFLIPDLTKHLLAQTAATGKPALVWTHYPSVARAMLLDGVATTTESSEPMAIIRMMDEFRGRREELEAEQGTTQTSMREATLMHASGVVGQKETSRLFANFNLPMLPEALMSNVDEAVAAAESMGFPIVMKLSADWMPHRSEHGAVKLNVGDVEAVRDAYRELEEVSSALNPSNEPYQMLIQPMVKSGIEMIVGARRDPGFGPFVTVGLGGVLVEIMREQQFWPPCRERRELERCNDWRRDVWLGMLAVFHRKRVKELLT
jgi:acyl-CoA synthetase (NDP forming)